MAWPVARTAYNPSEPAIPMDPLVGMVSAHQWVMVPGGARSGRTHRVKAAVASSGIPVQTVSLRGVSHAGLVAMLLSRTLRLPAVDIGAVAWALGEKQQGVVFDQADELLRNDPAAFHDLLRRFRDAGVSPIVVVGTHDPHWPDAVVCTAVPIESNPPVPLPIGMVPGDYADLLARNPAAVELSGAVYAFDPAWVRKALEDLAGLPDDQRTEAVLDLLGELALRRVGYLDPDAAALFHLARRLPAGMSWSDCDAVLPGSSADAVELLRRFHLASVENDRLHVLVRFPVASTPPLVDIFQVRWEEHLVRRLHGTADALADGDTSRDAPAAEDIENAVWLGRNALNPQTRGVLFVPLPRLIAHCGDFALARRTAVEWEQALRSDRKEPAVGWTQLLDADIALAEGDLVEAIRLSTQAVETFRREDDTVGLVAAHQACARSLSAEGNIDAAVDAAARALRTATTADWKHGQAESLRLLGLVSRSKGDPLAVRDAFTYASGLFEEIGNRRADLVCRICAAEALQSGGWIPEAFDAMARILDEIRHDAMPEFEPLLLIRLAELVRLSGDPHRAILIADAARDRALQQAHALAGRLAVRLLRSCFSEIGFGEPALACTVLERDLLKTLGHPGAKRLADAVETIQNHFNDGYGPDFVGGALHRAAPVVDDAVDRVRSLVALWELPVDAGRATVGAA